MVLQGPMRQPKSTKRAAKKHEETSQKSMIHQNCLKFPVYFTDSGVFKCQTCRCEDVAFHSDSKFGLFEPKKVIAKLHVDDVIDRNHVCPITDISEFGCLIPNKYQDNKPCSILNPFSDELQEIPTPIQFTM